MSGTSSAETDAAMHTVFLATVRRTMGSCIRRGLPTPLADADLDEIEKVLVPRHEDAILVVSLRNLRPTRSRSFYGQRTEAETRNDECVCLYQFDLTFDVAVYLPLSDPRKPSKNKGHGVYI